MLIPSWMPETSRTAPLTPEAAKFGLVRCFVDQRPGDGRAERIPACFVDQDVPLQMAPSSTNWARLTFRNSGTHTWSEDELFRLGNLITAPWNWGVDRVLLAPGETVAPGSDKTFWFQVSAPAATGTYPFQFRMLREGVTWFPAADSSTVLSIGVGQLALDADVVAVAVPSAMEAGQVYSATVRMRRDGDAEPRDARMGIDSGACRERRSRRGHVSLRVGCRHGCRATGLLLDHLLLGVRALRFPPSL